VSVAFSDEGWWKFVHSDTSESIVILAGARTLMGSLRP
jgi:hypothetical protein